MIVVLLLSYSLNSVLQQFVEVLVWIDPLPYRISRSDGQGGEGPIFVDKMRQHLLLDADEPVIALGSVCHMKST